jgi:hypothetical protein
VATTAPTERELHLIVVAHGDLPGQRPLTEAQWNRVSAAVRAAWNARDPNRPSAPSNFDPPDIKTPQGTIGVGIPSAHIDAFDFAPADGSYSYEEATRSIWQLLIFEDLSVWTGNTSPIPEVPPRSLVGDRKLAQSLMRDLKVPTRADLERRPGPARPPKPSAPTSRRP